MSSKDGNKVKLGRKQPMGYQVTYPFGDNGREVNYIWKGTKLTDKKINSIDVPEEVYDWLVSDSRCFEKGSLIIMPTENEDVLSKKENIENIEVIEYVYPTIKEIQDVISDSKNVTVLKKYLKDLDKKAPEDLKKKQKKYIVSLCSDLTVDSSSKRKAIVEWAEIDYNFAENLFDKQMQEEYKK